MLVLARKPNERLVIDGRIEVEVLEIRGNRVRLGVTAPRDMQVSRPDTASCAVEGTLAVVGST